MNVIEVNVFCDEGPKPNRFVKKVLRFSNL